MSGLLIHNPGILSLLQDNGRIGKHHLGLTTGGPLDPEAFHWANRLCGNEPGSTALELSVGGLKLEAQQPVKIAVTGAVATLKINGEIVQQWCTHLLNSGDFLEIGYASEGLRQYLAIAGGFQVIPQFGSTATVLREEIGGLSGKRIQAGDILECLPLQSSRSAFLPEDQQPSYHTEVTLRLILGYQHQLFTQKNIDRFFSSTYEVTRNSDRMGYRLHGQAIQSEVRGILSEGICLGAVQIPSDGQPIVLLNDRQTIGGYPKIGSVINLDLGRLAQLPPGGKVRFEQISLEHAEKLSRTARQKFSNTELKLIGSL